MEHSRLLLFQSTLTPQSAYIPLYPSQIHIQIPNRKTQSIYKQNFIRIIQHFPKFIITNQLFVHKNQTLFSFPLSVSKQKMMQK